MSGIGVANNFDIQSTKVIDNRCAGPSTDTNSLTYKAPGLLRYETDNDEWKYYDGTNFVDLISAGVTYTGGTGVLIDTNTNVISIGQDVETTSDVTFNSVTTNLIKTQENGNLEIATNTGGTETVRMTITNDGNLGLGTSPTEKLHILGDFRIDNPTTQTITFHDTHGGQIKEHGKIELTDNGGGADILFYTRPSGGNDPTEKMRITKDGNVGIGTSSPGSLLDINGTSNFRDLVNLDGLKVENRTDMVFGNPASVLYPTADNTTNLMIGYESNTERFSWKSIFLQARQNITLTAYNETFGIPISDTRITLASTGTESLDTITYTAPGGHNFWKTNSGQNGTIYSGDIFLKQNGVISTNTYAQLEAVPSGNNGGKLNINVKDNNGNFATSIALDPVSGLNTTRIVNLGDLINEGDITCSSVEIKTDSVGLQITSADGTTEQSFIYNSSGTPKDFVMDANVGSSASKGILFRTNGGMDRMRITADGRVGIGTNNPSKILTINTGATNGDAILITNDAQSELGYLYFTPTGNKDFVILAYNTATSTSGIMFRINSTDRMRIYPNGDVWMGKGYFSNQSGNAFRIQAYGVTYLILSNDLIIYESTRDQYFYGRHVYFYAPVSYPSDDRLKWEEEDITNGLEIVDKLKPQVYWKGKKLNVEPSEEERVRESGFIAQDVEQIPELAHTVSIAEATDQTEATYALNYTQLIAYNVSAIQELHKLVKTLQARIAILEGE